MSGRIIQGHIIAPLKMLFSNENGRGNVKSTGKELLFKDGKFINSKLNLIIKSILRESQEISCFQ